MRFLEDISDSLDLRAIAEKYELPIEAAQSAVERSISGTLSGIFRQDVECRLGGKGCEIYVFRENGVESFPMEKLRKNILRAVKYNLVSALLEEAVAHGYEKIRYLAGGIAGGHVSVISGDRIFVELDAGAGKFVVGVCEKEHQTPKERGRYRPGDYLNFHVLRVSPSSNGRVPVLKVTLSRTSRGLTEGLLRRQLSERLLNTKIRCVGRTAGAFSLVNAEGRLPLECIKAVSNELKERVIVHFVRQ